MTKASGLGRDVLDELPAIGACRAGIVIFFALRSQAFSWGDMWHIPDWKVGGRTRLGRLFTFIWVPNLGAKGVLWMLLLRKQSWILYRYPCP